MTASLRDLLYEKRERVDFITVYRASKGLEKINRKDLFVWDNRNKRGYEKKLIRTTCKRYKKIQLLI